MHHLINYDGYRATVRGICDFLGSLKRLLKVSGRVFVQEYYVESIVRDDLASRLLYRVSTMNLPDPLASWARVFIKSQGTGICFLTRRQWNRVTEQVGYRIVARENDEWRIRRSRRLAGFKHNGALYLLLSPV